MKKLLLLSALSLVFITSQAQKGAWQDDKTFHPFLSFAAAPRIGNNNTATGLETGFVNKNMLFKGGIGIGGWEKNEAIVLVGASRRLFTIGRFEEWPVLSTAQALTHKIPFNLSPQMLTRYQADKALNFFAGLGASFWFPNPKWTSLQYTMGVHITFRGHVDRAY